jgi:hypothetical protein
MKDFTYSIGDCWCIPLSGQDLVHIAVIHEQASFLFDSFDKPLLLFALA